MIGTLSKISLRVSRKQGDEAYGSYGVEAEAELNLPDGANFEEAFNALDALLTSAVGMSMKEKRETIQKHQTVAQPAQQAPVVQRAPVVEVRTPVGDDGQEFKDIDVAYIKVIFSEEGEKRARTYGKPWMQYGVITYPEVLTAIGFDLDAATAGQYALPAPYKKARVLIKGKNDKGFDMPGKVDHFIK